MSVRPKHRALSVFAALAVVVGTLMVAPAAHAMTFFVNSTANKVDVNPGDGTCGTARGTCTLRAAVMEANGSVGPDVVTVPAGTYRLGGARGENAAATGDLDITGDLTISGADRATTTLVGARDRVFQIFSAATVTISNLTIRRGKADNGTGGAGIANDGTLTLDNTAVRQNKVLCVCSGGGILNGSGATLTMNQSSVTNNVVTTGGGGGIDNSGTLIVTNSTISGNKAGSGAGISSTGTATLTNTNVLSNSAEIGGGIHNSGTMTIQTGSDVSNNSAEGDGGGIVNVFSGATLTISGSDVLQNTAGNTGGGIVNRSPLTISTTRIHDNSSQRGGGIYNESILTVDDSTFSENIATLHGGGGLDQTFGTATITDSTLVGNKAIGSTDQSGGGIRAFAGTTVVKNTTISNNQAIGGTVNSGGGIQVLNTADVDLVNVTIVANTAVTGGGGIDLDETAFDSISLVNTIVSDSFGFNVADCAGTIESLGHNLIRNTTGCTITGTTTGNITGVDPLLFGLFSNGGPTQTHLPRSNSPVLDAGDNAAATGAGLTTDQRGTGFARIVDGPDEDTDAEVDIGAVERQTTDTDPT